MNDGIYGVWSDDKTTLYYFVFKNKRCLGRFNTQQEAKEYLEDYNNGKI